MSNEIQAINRVRDQTLKHVQHLNDFNYSALAELYPSRGRKGRGTMTYKRFDTAAEAIRFAIEDLSPSALLGAHIEVDEARFGVHEIRFLYDSAAFPLKRSTTLAKRSDPSRDS